MYDGRKPDGVFTEKGLTKYIKETNDDRSANEESLLEESMEENMDFFFTEIEVYE